MLQMGGRGDQSHVVFGELMIVSVAALLRATDARGETYLGRKLVILVA